MYFQIVSFLDTGIWSASRVFLFLFTQISLTLKTRFQTPLWCLSRSSSYWSLFNHFQWGCAVHSNWTILIIWYFVLCHFLIFYNACVFKFYGSALIGSHLNEAFLFPSSSTILYLYKFLTNLCLFLIFSDFGFKEEKNGKNNFKIEKLAYRTKR